MSPTAASLTPKQRRQACDQLMDETAGLHDAPDGGWEIPDGCTRTDVAEAVWRWRRRHHHPVLGWVMRNSQSLFIALVAATWFFAGFMSYHVLHLAGILP